MFIVEWSEAQQAVSINTLEDVILKNQQAMMEGLLPCYVPVFASESRAEAKAYSAKLREQRDLRERAH